MSEILWEPSAERVERARLTAFIDQVAEDWGFRAGDYHALWRWSCDEPEKFWQSVWDFGGVVAETRGETALARRGDEPMFGARFFPEARLNFAENLLRRRGDGDAIVFRGEDRMEQRLSWDELHDRVAHLAKALEAMGVEEGDRVAGYLPNAPEAVIAMLATAARGAAWTSCSPDFGVQAVVDRFGQVEPKVLITADGYFYKFGVHMSLPRVGEFVEQLPSVEHVVVASYLMHTPELEPLAGWASSTGRHVALLRELVESHKGGDIDFRKVGFNDPLYVLYSSGTTGKPKCIVHGVGGTLLKHLAEHQLMCDVREDDRVFYFTTCGWMMWNWLVSGLASGATLLLYDGNPFYPGAAALLDFMQAERGTLFGVSAKYIDTLSSSGADPIETHDLDSIRTITSTGSPLAPEGFDYVYEHIKEDVCLSSISGGTDLVGCFVGGNPIGPVRRGEIQARVLGMAVDVYDEEGRPLRGEKGELVCTVPFPSMPIRFWDDPGDERYRAAYFEKYPGVWCHGDFAEITAHDGVIIHGRSDTTLNPGGVRIGTAEIYRQVERLEEVAEALVIGQDWAGDTRIVLFVKLQDDVELTRALVRRIKQEIRQGASPRHVPAKVVQVGDIPRTKSGKIVELAVRDVVHGRPVKNREALANPEALDQFEDLPELRS